LQSSPKFAGSLFHPILASHRPLSVALHKYGTFSPTSGKLPPPIRNFDARSHLLPVGGDSEKLLLRRGASRLPIRPGRIHSSRRREASPKADTHTDDTSPCSDVYGTKASAGTRVTVTESLYSSNSTSAMLAQAKRKSSDMVRQTMMPRTRWPGSASSFRTQFM
jgi:hypothetical protein